MRSNQKQYLVLGIGRFGSSLAKNLYKLGHEVLAVDRDENLVDDIAPYVTQAVLCSAVRLGQGALLQPVPRCQHQLGVQG